MAAKLKDQNANVVKLRPGKAKGAKSTGGRKPARAAKPRPGAKVIPPQPSDADVRRNRQDRALALHQQIKTTENKIAVASEALSDLRTVKKQQRASMANIYPLELYDDARKDADRKTEKVDLAAREKTRAEIREAFGLPAGPQAELELEKTPVAARPALHWYDVGARDCMDGKFADPTGAGAPPENLQDYMRGHADVTARIGAGIKGLSADSKVTPAAPPLMVGEDPAKAAAKEAAKVVITRDGGSLAPDWASWSTNPDNWADDQREAFTTWFQALDPDADVEIVHVGAAAMFDRLVEAESGGEPEVIGVDMGAEAHAGPAPAGIDYMLNSEEPFESGRQATYRDGQPLDAAVPGSLPYYDEHAFEATDAELAGQTQRRVVQEQRQAEDPGFSDD